MNLLRIALTSAILILANTVSIALEWIEYSGGSLQYNAAPNGDRVPDFREAGYGIAGDRIPDVYESIRISPDADGQDRAAIQAAIDQIASGEPDGAGFRGAVVLSSGEFHVDGPLTISTSGIVLRGSGSGVGGTTLLFKGEAGPTINLGGIGRWRASEEPRRIVDDYVPVGASTVQLDSVEGLSPGDRVIVQRPFTAAWLSKIGMDRIPEKADGEVKQWKPGSGVLLVRRIVSIFGSTVELDAPIVDGISLSDGGRLWRYEFKGEINSVGVENLTLDATPMAPRSRITYAEMRKLKLNAIEINRSSNVWVRNVSFVNFSTYIYVGSYASDVTAENVHGKNALPPWWRVPPPAFSVDGQRVLIRNCSFIGDHMVLVSTQSVAAGPIVFQDCEGIGREITAGPHQRWAVGVLFDNIAVPGSIYVGNRGNMGSGQGWTGANVVLWNSTAGTGFRVEEPPTAHTWLFGGVGAILPVSNEPAEVMSPGIRMMPRSLFDAQVEGF